MDFKTKIHNLKNKTNQFLSGKCETSHGAPDFGEDGRYGWTLISHPAYRPPPPIPPTCYPQTSTKRLTVDFRDLQLTWTGSSSSAVMSEDNTVREYDPLDRRLSVDSRRPSSVTLLRDVVSSSRRKAEGKSSSRDGRRKTDGKSSSLDDMR
ncbi:hypothetical protein LAZ67_11002267 [Cordylochernes scorpioides]|uniref:Uncharacterized protein n=1 Tax=Cordylochernes scorpioides TaxID=51811 RepID=A0ABY6KZ49_9ARAC|nr:hypothetical protein LAZ67_11002267 [Cordylochernes scorpioides]